MIALVLLVLPAWAAATTACSVASMPSISNMCPGNMVLITSGDCCPSDSVYTVTPATTSAPCFDKLNPTSGVSDCPGRAYLCNDINYRALMQDQCPKTCGYCTGGGGGVQPTTAAPNAPCVDLLNPSTGVSDCPRDAYLCNNSVYYQLMKQQCPKTCGFC